jgi:hypothetical protein
VLDRAKVFVEFTPQPCIERNIQQMPDDFELDMSPISATSDPVMR